MSQFLNTEDILNSIDLNKLNMDKKRRGRPPKSSQHSSQVVNKFKNDKNISIINDHDEIILHLGISSNDIKNNKSMDNDYSTNDSCNDTDTNDTLEPVIGSVGPGTGGIGIGPGTGGIGTAGSGGSSSYIKKLKDENDELRHILKEYAPMYFTEIKIYPSSVKLFDKQDNEFVPKKTTISCWWCTHTFDNLPCYIPTKITDNKFSVFGCFCSFNCACSYNLNINDNKVWERYTLLKLLYYKINHDKIISIKDIEINPAGPKELLEKYGGSMNIVDYRKNCKIMGREYHKLIPPFIPLNLGFEEMTNNKVNKIMNINNLLSNSIIKNEVVVKRNKPLNNIASKEIDSFMD
jgi:hypothetical protein